MNLSLCGINIPFEEQNDEKVAANRIVNMDLSFDYYDHADIAGSLEGIINDSIGILAAIKSDNPCDIHSLPIDKKTVNKELNILSKSLKKIKLSVDQKISSNSQEDYGTKIGCREHSVLEQVMMINDLAKEMLVKSLIDDPAASLFLMIKDTQPNIAPLPQELHEMILISYLSVKIQDAGF